jgi:hypothetical protein
MRGLARKHGGWSTPDRVLCSDDASSIVRAMFILFAAAATVPVPLSPSGNWNVEYDDTQCLATRSFGDPKEPVRLVIKPSPTSDVTQLLLLKERRLSTAVQHNASIQVGNRPAMKVKQLNYGARQFAISLVNLDASQAAHLEAGGRLVWTGYGADVDLAIGSTEKLMRTIADCRADLRDHWNISEEKRARLRSGAAGVRPLRNLFNWRDYPAQSLSEGDSGTTSIVALIDEKGAVAECMIDGTSGIATLDAVTCIGIKERAKFTPAIGEDGNPARSAVTTRVKWVNSL